MIPRRLRKFVKQVEPAATWDDLALPPAQVESLREIERQVRERQEVKEEWEFGEDASGDRGVTAVFAGAPGAALGAAEVLARELRMRLFLVDLQRIVSEYIGETEKDLRRVFEAAEAGGAILFFDEADALFGKRSEVRNSHDRYANVEVSYLLHRAEAGSLTILAANDEESLDPNLLERVRFIVRLRPRRPS